MNEHCLAVDEFLNQIARLRAQFDQSIDDDSLEFASEIPTFKGLTVDQMAALSEEDGVRYQQKLQQVLAALADLRYLSCAYQDRISQRLRDGKKSQKAARAYQTY